METYTYNELSERYNQLEDNIQNTLIIKINNSKYISKHVDQKAIKVNVFDYTELTIIDNELTFLDSNGLQYDLYCECSLEDLLYIIKVID